MLKFLKNLFSLSLEEADVKKENLLSWFEGKTALTYQSLAENINENYNKLGHELFNLKNSVELLDTAQIKDEEKIEPKVKSVVLGHRSNYANQVRLFLQELNVPSENNYQIALNFSKKLDEKLGTLAENTTKSYYTTQHLFFDEVERVSKVIKEVSKINESTKKIIDGKNVDKLLEIREKISNLYNREEIKAQVHNLIDEKRQSRSDLTKKRNEMMTEIIEIEKSGDFLEFMRIKEKESQINKEFSKSQDNILQFLFPFERALRKLRKVTVVNEKIIERYIEHPVETLVKDGEFKLLEIAKNLERNIKAGSVELKDVKEKEKTLARIQEVTKEKLEFLIDKFKESDKLKKEVLARLDKFQVMKNKKIKEKELEALNEHLKLVEEELKVLTEKSQIDFDNLENQIIEDIAKFLRVRVNLYSDEEVQQGNKEEEAPTQIRTEQGQTQFREYN